jgi:eukaryotic-like serine/threonine-protein kinase
MAASPTDEVRVGTVLRDTYEITDLIGRGGMGVVFGARHLRLPGKRVAVKVLQGEGALSPEQYARFRREAEIASRLGHPNIVEVLDFHSLESGTPYLVLEFLQGETLAKRLQRAPMATAEVMAIARQIGSALHAAHRAGVVHRDLKPDNVFLVPTDSGGVVSNRVKLLDFGISKLANYAATLQTQDAVLMGTPLYMSPEQAMGKNREIDARADIFSLGCIVYEMLSGKAAFAAEGIAQVIYKVVNENPPPLASVVSGIADSVIRANERALSKDPSARYPDVASYIADLTGSPLQTLSNPAVPVATATNSATDSVSLGSTLPTPSSRAPGGLPAIAEVPAPLAPTTIKPIATGRSMKMALGAGAVSVAGVLAIVVLSLRHSSDNPLVPPPAPSPAVVARPAEPTPPPVTKTSSPTEPTRAPSESPPATGPSSPHSSPVTHPAKAEAVETLATQATEDLKEAEALLDSGNWKDALRLASQSQLSFDGHPGVKSGWSYSVITRANCGMRDLVNAKPSFLKVSGAHRKRVVAFCKEHGIEFE